VLAAAYDLLLFDLDGVVYVGEEPVPGASAALSELRRRGFRARYVTNNASRRAETVAALLRRLGAPATATDVLTSAQASAQLLAERFEAGSPVLIVGADALAEEIDAVGLSAVFTAAEKPVAVVQGYGPDVGWRNLAEAMLAITAGALWVATNTDRTVPSPHGRLPGNGAIVAALATALGRQPDVVVGKPGPALFATAAQRWHAERPLVIGDRLDTDIEGAVRAGYDSVLVLTGVSTATDVLEADPQHRPRYLVPDLEGLLEAYPEVVNGDGARCRGWTVTDDGDRLRLTGTGAAVDALRALCAAAWCRPVKPESPQVKVLAESAEAAEALAELGIPAAG
jgi:HAD superfamily hydrolase (TIGR01450 family)